MEINTTHNLVSYPEFLSECERALRRNRSQFQSVNYTEKPHCGGTENLYEVQDHGIDTVIEYTQTRLWVYTFNGTSGRGLTIDQAKADHREKYDDAFLEFCRR